MLWERVKKREGVDSILAQSELLSAREISISGNRKLLVSA